MDTASEELRVYALQPTPSKLPWKFLAGLGLCAAMIGAGLYLLTH